MDLFLLYQYFITISLILIFFNFIINNILFKNTVSFPVPNAIRKSPPLVSILIPARNEAKNIRRCLRSLLKQDYPHTEILVLNDNSTDDTELIVRKMARKNNKIRIITGKTLPKGWLGKSYACYQLSKYANGEYFIFTDADTLHFDNSISSAVNSLISNKIDALSIYPMQIMVTIHERMVVTFINFMILSFFPIYLIRKSKNPLFCTAIGQFMMFKRDVYEKIGGHKSVRKEILDDIHISKQVKRFGYKFMVFDGSRSIYCRMYKSFNEVFRGFSKFIFAAFDYNLYMEIIVILLVSAIFLFPFLLLPAGIFIFNWPGPVINNLIIQIFMVLSIKAILSIRFKNRIFDIFLHPLSMIYIILIAINSILQTKGKRGILWKDRLYDVNEGENLDILNDKYVN